MNIEQNLKDEKAKKLSISLKDKHHGQTSVNTISPYNKVQNYYKETSCLCWYNKCD